MFTEQSGGYWCPATEKALAFADGDKGRLVAACFAGFLRSFEVGFEWDQVGLGFTVEPHGSLFVVESEIAALDAVWLTPKGEYSIAAQVHGEKHPLISFVGGTYALRWDELRASFFEGRAIPIGQLLSIQDWLRSFPHLHTPCPEIGRSKGET